LYYFNSYIRKTQYKLKPIKKMTYLLIILFAICGTFGATISKTTTDYGVKKNRDHNGPLTLDKGFTGE
jgi:hypothetical protein